MKTLVLRQSRLTPGLRLWLLSTASACSEDIPSEIWHTVCVHLDRVSLSAVRRVCHRLADIAAHYLFQKLYVTWLPRSLERLKTLASHPNLRYRIKTLVFEQELLQAELANFDIWKQHADAIWILTIQEDLDQGKDPERAEALSNLRRRLEPWKRLIKDEDLGCIHQMVVTLVNGQQDLLADRGTPGMLARLISRLPNLDTIQMMSASPYEAWTYHGCDAEEPDMADDDRWGFVRLSLEAELLVSCPYADNDHWRRPLQPFSLLLRAIASAPTRTTNLRIGAIPADFWMGGDKPWTYESIVMPTMGTGLLTLRSLDLRLVVDTGNHRMAHFLQRCPNVTHLKLRIHSTAAATAYAGASGPRGGVYWQLRLLSDISGLLAPLHLPHLQHLKIDQFSITEEAFTTFVEAHAETLRSMVFRIPYMTSPDHPTLRISSWEKVLGEVAPFMSLEQVDLGMLGDSALSALFDSEGQIYDRRWDNRKTRFCAFASAVAAYLVAGGKGDFPRYEATVEGVGCEM